MEQTPHQQGARVCSGHHEGQGRVGAWVSHVDRVRVGVLVTTGPNGPRVKLIL